MGLALILLGGALLTGCTHSERATSDNMAATGPLFDDLDEDGRETVLIEPVDEEGLEAFDVRPAVFDTALIRVDPNRVDGAANVEVLLKGSFPDACFQLHELDQRPSRSGQVIVLTMRRPTDAICAQVVRPYRFFFTLDRRITPGRYDLQINEESFAFEVDRRSKP